VTLLARLAGDMALLTLARGGVYLAGGIAQKLMPGLDADLFRAAFEDKAPHQAIMAGIPVMVMTHPTAALEGLAAWVRQPDGFSLEGAARRFS
jgi:glucokinase